MKTLEQAQQQAHTQIEKIVGNLKGGVIDPTQAVELLDQVVLDTLNTMRHPGEPAIERFTITEDEQQMAAHFNQADKDN